MQSGHAHAEYVHLRPEGTVVLFSGVRPGCVFQPAQLHGHATHCCELLCIDMGMLFDVAVGQHTIVRSGASSQQTCLCWFSHAAHGTIMVSYAWIHPRDSLGKAHDLLICVSVLGLALVF